jgi:hypothetical protein
MGRPPYRRCGRRTWRFAAMIELRLSTDHNVELYFPAPGGLVEPRWLELVGNVLAHLTAIDNEVQRVSAAQWEWPGSTYPSSYYEGELAYITLTEPCDVVLRYYVIGCNSEWDERFVRTEDRWVRVVEADPLSWPTDLNKNELSGSD